MSIKSVGRTLRTLVLALALSTGVACGLNVHGEYYFRGMIGKEDVEFYEDLYSSNILQVTKPDGTIIRYKDGDDDLKVGAVTVLDNGRRVDFYLDSSNPKERELFLEFQEQFESYLERILEINSSKVLDP